MGIAKLSSLLKFLGGGEPNETERRQLYKEALLMTLARASSSDSNVNPVEVETVQKIVQQHTGEAVSTADVRVAAASEIFETATLDQYLSRVTRKLRSDERATIVRSLAEVIHSDVKVTSREIDFFNKAARALKATPAEIAGLTIQEPVARK
jgi:uncharacterized tellurite resistance protein B-like protein